MTVQTSLEAGASVGRSLGGVQEAPAGGAAPAAGAGAAILRSLNEEQRAAATHDLDRPLLVQAGAGTGKTTTLIARVAHALQKRVNPRCILVLTYTNKMAGEARQRLARQGLAGAERVTCSTVHALCLRILRDNWREAGFSRPPSVLRDGQEAQHALERCIKLARLQALLPQAGRWLGLAEAGASWQRVLAALWSQGQQRRDAIRRILAAARRQSEQLQREREEQRQRREGRHEPTLAQRQAAARAGAAAALAEERRAAAALADEESPSKAARTAAGASGVSQSPQQALRQAAAAVGEAAAEAGASGSSSRRQLWQEQGGEEDCSAQQPGEDVSSGAQQPWKEGGLTPAPQTQEPVHAVRRLWGDEEESESSQQAVPRLAGLEPEAQVAAIAGLYSLLRGLQPEDQRSAEEERAWLSARTVHAHEVLEQRAWIRRHKDFCRSPDLFPEGPERAAWELYQRELLRLGRLDFSDMLALTVRLLRADERVAQRLRSRHTHVLVDEFQDCNPLQVELALLLGGPSGRLTAVGDAAQSIFGFTAATPRVFELFSTALREQYGREATRLALRLNYRSTAHILRVGNAVLGGEHPELVAAGGERGEPVVITAYRTAAEEAAGIATRIQELAAEGVRYRDMAVLYRFFKWGGKTYAPLQAELDRRGIPYRRLREKRVLEDTTVQALLAHLRLLLDPADDPSFLAALNQPPRGLGEAVVAALLDRQARREVVEGAAPGLEQCARDLCSGAGAARSAHRLQSAQRASLAAFLALLDRLRGELWTRQPAEVVDRVLQATGLFKHWREQQRGQQAQEQAQEAGSDSDDDEQAEAGAADQGGGQQEAGGPPAAAEPAAQQEEEEDRASQARDIFQAYRLRCRATGALGAVQREAAAFTHGAWQAGQGPRPDDAYLDGRGPPSLLRIAYRSLFVDPAAAEEAAAAPKDEPGRAAPREQEQGWSETELLDHLLGRQGACAAATAAAAAHAAAGGASASQDASAAAAREDPQADAGGSLLASVAGALCLGWAPLAEFLAHLEVGAQEGEDPLSRGVAISTIHSAKGMEWDVVFSPRWYEGFLPNKPFEQQEGGLPLPVHPVRIGQVAVPEAGGNAEHYAEARRLAHVAATRARRRHFVSHPAELISKRGYPYPVEPSRFLDDVLRRYGNTQVVRLEVPGAEPAAAAAPAPA